MEHRVKIVRYKNSKTNKPYHVLAVFNTQITDLVNVRLSDEKVKELKALGIRYEKKDMPL
jgi:hypothetical protein